MTLEAASEVPYMRERIASESVANIVTESVIVYIPFTPISSRRGPDCFGRGIRRNNKRSNDKQLTSTGFSKEFFKNSSIKKWATLYST